MRRQAPGQKVSMTTAVKAKMSPMETARLVEEKTYSFTPGRKRFIINENGETVANFYITGKGEKIVSGTKTLL